VEITLEECMQKQFSMVRATATLILKHVEPLLKFRRGFDQLVCQCRIFGVPLIIVSAGLDFCIQHFLELNGWLKTVEVQCSRIVSVSWDKGIKFEHIKPVFADSTNLKDDLVRQHKKMDEKVIYVGDGLADLTATTFADYPFAIGGSKLAKKCRTQNTACKEIRDFRPVVQLLRKLNHSSTGNE